MVLQITPWERQLLQQLACGAAPNEIASRGGVRECDVESRLTALLARMGVTTTTEAIAAAARRGLLAA